MSACKGRDVKLFIDLRDDYEIYSIILKESEFHHTRSGKVRRYVIAEDTSDARPAHCYPEDVFFIKNKSMPSNLASASEDFKKKNNHSLKLIRAFNLNKEYILGDDAAILREFRIGDSIAWDQFYKAYPDTCGLIFFSRVGFNLQKDKAFVNEMIAYIPDSRGGYIYKMSKNGELWCIDEIFVCGVS
ncbi:MAG: hypothetical protein IPJ07_13500 [Acidobacteria bacterium]|nr:hypothetical protein [Acidobacteriota bacterium]